LHQLATAEVKSSLATKSLSTAWHAGQAVGKAVVPKSIKAQSPGDYRCPWESLHPAGATAAWCKRLCRANPGNTWRRSSYRTLMYGGSGPLFCTQQQDELSRTGHSRWLWLILQPSISMPQRWLTANAPVRLVPLGPWHKGWAAQRCGVLSTLTWTLGTPPQGCHSSRHAGDTSKPGWDQPLPATWIIRGFPQQRQLRWSSSWCHQHGWPGAVAPCLV